MPVLGTRGAASLKNFGFAGIGRPAPPSNVTATRKTDGTIDVQYSLNYNGGLTITSATAVSTPGSITATTTSPNSGLINVSGLTLGTAYTFVVFATNAIGNSVNSQASNSQVAARPPNAPTIGTVSIASPTSVNVPFTAPDNNGEAITSYTATSSPGGITRTINQAGSGTITVTGLTSGTTYSFRVFATNAMGNSANSAASNSVTPNVPTYTISGPSSVNEGGTATINVVTNETVAATTLYWTVSGTNITASELGLASLNGTLSVSTNTTNSLSFSISADQLTEGSESFTTTFYTDSGRTTLLSSANIGGSVTGNGLSITINDTSLTPAPTYSVARDQSSVNEGGTASFTVTTTNFGSGQPPNGSGTLYWNIEAVSGAVDSTDLSPTQGSVSISSNSGSISISVASDLTTEGTESFRVRLYTDSGRTNQVATSGTVTINDTSLTPPQLNASASLNYNYVIAGLPSQTKAYYLIINRDSSGPSTQTWSVSTGGLSIQSGIGTGSSSGTFSSVITNAVVGFTGPHSSATVTVTVSATGYTSYSQSFSVAANSLYTPYNFSRGFPQEFPSTTGTRLSNAQTITNTVYESISTAYTVPSAPGGFTTWYGLGRRADVGGANFWGNYCVDNGIGPSSSQFYDAFFSVVNAAGSGDTDYQAARTNSKSFRLGTGYDKFYDRP